MSKGIDGIQILDCLGWQVVREAASEEELLQHAQTLRSQECVVELPWATRNAANFCIDILMLHEHGQALINPRPAKFANHNPKFRM